MNEVSAIAQEETSVARPGDREPGPVVHEAARRDVQD